MAISINEFLQKFEGVKPESGYWMAKCPAHDDRKQSLSIKQGREGGIVVFCHAKCETRNVLAAIGCTFADVQPENNGHKSKIVATYDYRDESGKLLYQVVRFDPKDFRPRRLDGAGKWIWNLEGVDRVLYRLPELLADDSDGWVFIVEGEADGDNLRALGPAATSNVGGAGKWREGYVKYFKGRKVCIIPDNDPPPTIGKDGKLKEGFQGQKHAVKIYDSIRGAAKCAVILALRDLPVKGDTSDWIRAGGTRDDLLGMADDLAKIPAEQFAARVSQYARLMADPDFSGDPAVALREDPQIQADQIQIDHGLINKLHVLTELAWQALLKANKPPKYFRRGSMLVKVAQEDDGVVLKELTPDRMRCELDLVADWRKKGYDHYPPKDVVTNVLVWPHQPLPPLDRVVEVPIFAPNGKLQTEPGYHPDARVYYWPSRHLKCLPVPTAPTAEDVRRAIALIEELICDFPFASQSDKCHAIAMLLLPFCRGIIVGPTPNHLVEASMPRCGKSKLATSILSISLGKNIHLMTAPRENDEWEKKITTALLEDTGAILIDNVNHRLDSDKLAAALTADEHKGRILGRNASASIPIRCVWVTTANNLNVTEENAGRMIRIRLTPATDSPERRTGFKYPDLGAWIASEREKLIQAAHILIQHWIASGRPKPSEAPLGSYENWSHVIGGILGAAGIPGFLANFAEFYAASNKDKMVWREFIDFWWKAKGEKDALTSDLLPIAASIEGFYLRGESEQSRKISLGRQLEKKEGAVYSGFRIVRAGLSGGYVYWKLEPLEQQKEDQ